MPTSPLAAKAREPLWQCWLPRTLFGQLVLVLFGGLAVAQLLSLAIHLAERDRLLSSGLAVPAAQRVADVVNLLDGLDALQRQALTAVLATPPMVLSLSDAPSIARVDELPRPALRFAARLQAALGDGRELRLQPREDFTLPPQTAAGRASGPHGPGSGMGGMGMGMGRGSGMGAGMPDAGRAARLPVLRVEVQLRDGSWARVDTELPRVPAALPWRLGATLALLLASVLALSYVAVRWAVRPLQRLTAAALSLGEDLSRPPLAETGPHEVRLAARAFNTMQQRLAAFVDERTRMLAALSHDLKTPLTRMRLRADLMDDENLRQRFEADLKEMESMVSQTLEFMRGLGGDEPRQPVDIDKLLAALAADQRAMGRDVVVEGHALQPCMGMPSLLRRALGNLVDNAALHGRRATLRVQDSPTELAVHVLDDGPGVPESELQRVFEPFVRLEVSRSRDTGGTGLGLGIARNVARAHGGDLVLHNRPEGGLDALLTLPRVVQEAPLGLR